MPIERAVPSMMRTAASTLPALRSGILVRAISSTWGGFASDTSHSDERPMVYTTTILLLLIVMALNLVAIVVRNRLRRRYQTSAF